MAESKKPAEDERTTRKLDDRKMTILTMLDVVKSKRRFFYLTITLTVLGTLLGHFLQVPTFETKSTLFVQNIDQPSAAEYLLNQHIYKLSRVDRIDSYVNHLNSDSFLLKVAEKIKFDKSFHSLNVVPPQKKSKLRFSYWKDFLLNEDDSYNSKVSEREKKLLLPLDSISGFLRNTVRYSSDYSSQFIEVHVKTLDPQTSQLIANLIVEEFVGITNKLNLNEVKQVEEFVKVKKTESELNVRKLDAQLIAFKKKNNIISADATTRGLAERLTNLESQIASAKLQKSEYDKVLKYLTSGRQKALNKIFKDGSRTEDFATAETSFLIQSKIDQLKLEKSTYLAQGFTDNDWQVEKINREIDSNVARLKSTVADPTRSYSSLNPEIARAKIEEVTEKNRAVTARISTLKAARIDLQKQVDRMPSLQQEYIQLENKFKLEIESLASLERKEKELEIQRISHKKEIRIDQLAELPTATPRGSLFLKLIFSSLVAVFLGLVVILGLESLDPTVKSRQDLFDCGLEFLGELPFVHNEVKTKKRSGRFQFGSPDDLVCKIKPESIESMSFKYMRARIESMRYKENKKSQVISISSALHNEGKSFVASNLAISLAQLNRKVILIDADLRRPSQSAYFGMATQSGLVDLLSIKKDLSEVVVTGKYKNLDIIPAGFSGLDSTELISSQKFRLLIEHLREEYEYIVIDTPPTFAVVDAAIVSSFSDVPILVSSFRETRKADLYEAYNDLLQVSYKNVYGVINKAIVSNSRIHYYGYPLYNQQNEATSISSINDDDTEEFLRNLKKKPS